MATLTFRLYEDPAAEVGRLLDDPPQWVARLFEVHRVDLADGSLSVALEALVEELEHRLGSAALLVRKAERRGWSVELQEGTVRVTTALAVDRAQAALREDGVWHLAQRLAGGLSDTEVFR
jgi:hypothetical protein